MIFGLLRFTMWGMVNFGCFLSKGRICKTLLQQSTSFLLLVWSLCNQPFGAVATSAPSDTAQLFELPLLLAFISILGKCLAAGILVLDSSHVLLIPCGIPTVQSMDPPLCAAASHTSGHPHISPDAGPISAKRTVQENKGGLLRTQHCLSGGLPIFLHVSNGAICLL